uniref:GMC_oxred_C domain-containing protein n=1 Tax=Caenorhabditis tropicalis TaxID=1561998 RepID=A0A1I7UEK0_9PELO
MKEKKKEEEEHSLNEEAVEQLCLLSENGGRRGETTRQTESNPFVNVVSVSHMILLIRDYSVDLGANANPCVILTSVTVYLALKELE